MKRVSIVIMWAALFFALPAYAQYEFIELESLPQSMDEVLKLEKERRYTEVSEKYLKDHFIQIRNEVSDKSSKYCFVFGICKTKDCEFILFSHSSAFIQNYYIAAISGEGHYPPLLQIGDVGGMVLWSGFVLLDPTTILITTLKSDCEFPYFCQEIYRLDKNFTRLSEPFHDENCDNYWGGDIDEIIEIP